MSSLAKLVAGGAHEINNPVSFIYDQIVHVNQYVLDLFNLINIYQTYYSGSQAWWGKPYALCPMPYARKYLMLLSWGGDKEVYEIDCIRVAARIPCW